MIKKRAYEKSDGTVAVITFAPKSRRPGETDEEMMTRIWLKMKQGDPTIPDDFVDVENADMPERTDADGVSVRCQWRIKNKKLKKDSSVENFWRKLYDDQQALDALLDQDDWTDQKLKQIEKLRNKIDKWRKKISRG